MGTAFEMRGKFARQFLSFDNKNSKDFHLYLSGPAVYNSPSADVSSTSVPGRNGDLILENAKPGQRRYSNVDITYEAFFFDGLPAKTAAVKSWLLSPVGYRNLQDTYDPDFFRMAVCTEAIDFEVKRQKAASMTLKFNCKPQRWSVDGQKAIRLDAPSQLRNPYRFPSQPLIRVYGEGEGKLTVGNKAVIVHEVGGHIDLNCETQNAYRDGVFCNTDIFAEDFPELQPGIIPISWEGGITAVEVTPRWWTL